jgi:YVTN family beta-propeller protein
MSLDACARRAAQAARTNVDRLAPPPPIGVLAGRRRRRTMAANALALAVVVAVSGAAWRVLAIGGQEPAATRLPRHVQAAIRVGNSPGAVLVAEGSVWVANRGDGTISRVDPATNRVIATIGVGANPTRLTADSGAVWVATAEGIQRIDPATNQVIRTLPFQIGLGDVLAADGHLWISLEDGTVRRLDPTDGRVLGSFIPAAPKGVALLASGRGRLWVGYGDMLVTIDPQDARVAGPIGTLDAQGKQFQTQGPQLTGLVLVDGVVWRSSSDPSAGVVRFWIDPPKVMGQHEEREVLQSEEVLVGETSGLAAGPTGVFAVGRTTLTLTRLDLSTGEAKARIRLPGLSQVAAGADAVWATADTRDILYRIDPGATD